MMPVMFDTCLNFRLWSDGEGDCQNSNGAETQAEPPAWPWTQRGPQGFSAAVTEQRGNCSYQWSPVNSSRGFNTLLLKIPSWEGDAGHLTAGGPLQGQHYLVLPHYENVSLMFTGALQSCHSLKRNQITSGVFYSIKLLAQSSKPASG